ncbi:MAG: hypothetical protein ACYDEA_01540 [Candidatus Dormibacteria bacterium]
MISPRRGGISQRSGASADLGLIGLVVEEIAFRDFFISGGPCNRSRVG